MNRLAAGAVLLLGLGCGGYYNGMYNTERFANQARKAERDGRTFDAATLWGQVATRAESVLVRHPNSRWSQKARLLQGMALSRLNNCDRAIQPLEEVMVAARDVEVAEQAAVLLGDCRTALGDASGAAGAYVRLTSSANPDRRSVALWAHGRALREEGNIELALAELNASNDLRAQGERAAVLAALGRGPEAKAVLDSLVGRSDTMAPWDAIYNGFAARDAAAATGLVDRIAADTAFPPAIRAMLLLQDGERLMTVDPGAADLRLTEAARAGEGTPIRGTATLRASYARLARADSAADLVQELKRLEVTGEAGGSIAPRAFQLALLIRQVLVVTDSTPAAGSLGDLRLFLAAELARDSLGSPRFSARQFRRIVVEWPQSEYAPKALLSLIVLEPEAADSLRREAVARYGESPYLLMSQGQEGASYEVLEDSLRRFADSFHPEVRRPVAPGPRTPRPAARPATPRDNADKP